jgi:hypothetical protein
MQTAAERRPSRTHAAGDTDGDAPAIRTLWEGGPSECWGEGLFEKPSVSHCNLNSGDPPSGELKRRVKPRPM